jgi:hypothetical protein
MLNRLLKIPAFFGVLVVTLIFWPIVVYGVGRGRGWFVELDDWSTVGLWSGLGFLQIVWIFALAFAADYLIALNCRLVDSAASIC